MIEKREKRRLEIHRKSERRIQWGTAFGIGGIHLGALLAFYPDYFSVSGLVLSVVLYFVAGLFGVTLCFHRLLTHRSFQTYKWVEYLLTFFGCLALQSSPMQWTAMHRLHHKEADHEPDPHSPLVNFLWAHMGWLFMTLPDSEEYEEYSRFTKDMDRDPVQRWFTRWFFRIYAGFAVLVYAAGELYGGLGMSWLVWGIFVRTTVLWHTTWLVNSATHLWGYRNYQTDEDSTNNWIVAVLSFGEGWHNNHHADQRSAAHGQRWFEVDITYWIIRLMGGLGLAWRILEPRGSVVARRVDIMVDDEALRFADALAEGPAGDAVLHTMTDPTVPVDVPRMPSAAEAYAAAEKSAREALEAAESALAHAAKAIEEKKKAAVEMADQTVKQMLEGAKDLAMTAVERAKIGASEAAEFAGQASAYAAEAREQAAGAVHKATDSVADAIHRAADSARHFADQSRLRAQEASEAAARAAEEIAIAFHGIGRNTITAV